MRAKAFVAIALSAVTVVAALIFCAVLFVGISTASRRTGNPADIPRRTVALVFGAGLGPGGKPSGMLADRLDAAIGLWRAHKVAHLLLSGDNGSIYYNEVAAMERYVLERRVPQRAITLDYAGFNTYASCYRARKIFGVRTAVLVTQHYHLPRAVYLCNRLGIAAIGLGTPDWGRVPAAMMFKFELREYFATVRALFDVNVTHPQPKYLGKYEGLK